MEQTHQTTAEGIIQANKTSFLSHIADENSWKLDSDKEGIKLSFKKDPVSGQQMTKCESIIKKSVTQISDYLHNNQNRQREDSNVLEFKELEKFTDDFRIVYTRNKGHTGFDGRELCFAVQRFFEGDQITIIRGNYDHPSAVTPKGFVRATVILIGFQITKIDEISSKLVYISCVNPNGRIPDFLKKKIAQRAAEKFRTIRQGLNSQ